MAGKRVLLFGWASKVQVHLFRWARGLKERGYDVKVVALGGTPIEGIETVNLPRKGKLSYFRQVRAAVNEAHRFKPDLVHAHYATGYGYWAYRTNIKPTVVSVWGADVIDFPTVWYKRALVRRVLKRATHITATSQLLKRKTLDILPGSGNKITVIPFGVNLPDNQRPMPDTPVKMCFIKNHNWKYGPDILLEAMAQVKKTCPHVKLSMAGTGELNEYLKQMATRLDINDVVDFVGFVPHDKMYSFIADHHFMVMPSVSESESFGVAVLEAGACGRAVLTSRIGGVPEVVVDGETGRLLPPGDRDKLAEAIIEFAGNPDRLRGMGRAGYEFVKENYTWDRSLDLMTDLYDRLLHEKK
ncbi:MAG: glycosyltransferase family 4 protein [Candidatus Zixiibacteriota bacterium]|nr:MAG: glycosyltransferase family 4 protein [candidate division Zixibacteria bacterium]